MGRPIYKPSFDPDSTPQPDGKNNKTKIPKVKLPPTKPPQTPK